MSTFQIVVEAEQQNGGPQKRRLLEENGNSTSRSNHEQEMDKAIKRRKGVEIQPISVGLDAGTEACSKKPTEKIVICTGKKVYRPPLPST